LVLMAMKRLPRLMARKMTVWAWGVSAAEQEVMRKGEDEGREREGRRGVHLQQRLREDTKAAASVSPVDGLGQEGGNGAAEGDAGVDDDAGGEKDSPKSSAAEPPSTLSAAAAALPRCLMRNVRLRTSRRLAENIF
jgi:hypothetical protein